MKRVMTLKTRFILTSYCSIVISVFLICIVSYVLLGNLSRKFAIPVSYTHLDVYKRQAFTVARRQVWDRPLEKAEMVPEV